MDLNTIDDLQTLKSMAYDQIAAKEQAEANLRLINQRILEVATKDSLPKAPYVPKGPSDQPASASVPTADAPGAPLAGEVVEPNGFPAKEQGAE